MNGASTQIGHPLFLEKYEQTKIGDLRALPEIWKSRSTEILSAGMGSIDLCNDFDHLSTASPTSKSNEMQNIEPR